MGTGELAPGSGTLAVVGAGAMGTGIAQLGLEAGWRVRLLDADPGAATRGHDRIRAGLQRRAEKRNLDPGWTTACLASLALERSVESAVDGADVVVEAIVEDLAAKQVLFAALDAHAAPAAILATNTSALSVAAIAAAAERHPERVLGLHFFNPAQVMLLVEVVAGAGTAPDVLARATAVVESWGKTTVRSADRPGFIVNRVNRPFTIEALRMLEAGEARLAEIDAAIRDDGFPMGPFELMDFVGLDVNLAAASAIWEGLGRPERLRPSPIQAGLVANGRLGRKSGAGFYRYRNEHDPVPDPIPHDLAPRVRDDRALTPERIVRRVREAVAEEAIAARDEGVATAEDIDTALWLGAAHPEGPFAWLRRHDPTIAR